MAAVLTGTGTQAGYFRCSKCLKQYTDYAAAVACCPGGRRKCVRCPGKAVYIIVMGCLDGHIWHAEFCKEHWENAVLMGHRKELRCLDQGHEGNYPRVEDMIWKEL